MNIHGKEYVEVKDRIAEFNQSFPNGMIETEIVNQTESTITIRAKVTPDVEKPQRYFTGHAQEWKDDPKSPVNKTSYVENCETSAWGRALAAMGIGVVDSIASADEVEIAKNKEARAPLTGEATEKQRGMIYGLYLRKNGKEMSDEEKERIRQLNKQQASELIDKWTAKAEDPWVKRAEETAESLKKDDADEISFDDIPF